MKTIQKNTMRNGYKFQVEYRAVSKADLHEIERSHLGSVHCGISGMIYEIEEQEVA